MSGILVAPFHGAEILMKVLMHLHGSSSSSQVSSRTARILAFIVSSLLSCCLFGQSAAPSGEPEQASEAETVFSGGAVFALEPGELRMNPQDGQRYVWIPPGYFRQGCVPDDIKCKGHERPRRTVRISRGFWLRESEVTVGEYEAYSKRKRIAMPWSPGFIPTVIPLMPPISKGFNYKWEDKEQPMLMLAWKAAADYCSEQAGGRLPTEAEWEYASRGGVDGQRYGHREEISHNLANYGAETCCKPLAEGEDEYLFAAPVKQFPPNPFGLYDMQGNVWEWTQDWYDSAAYEAAEEEKDPKGPASGTLRVIRGGGYDNAPAQLRPSERHSANPALGSPHIGFRCVAFDLPAGPPVQ